MDDCWFFITIKKLRFLHFKIIYFEQHFAFTSPRGVWMEFQNFMLKFTISARRRGHDSGKSFRGEGVSVPHHFVWRFSCCNICGIFLMYSNMVIIIGLAFLLFTVLPPYSQYLCQSTHLVYIYIVPSSSFLKGQNVHKQRQRQNMAIESKMERTEWRKKIPLSNGLWNQRRDQAYCYRRTGSY